MKQTMLLAVMIGTMGFASSTMAANPTNPWQECGLGAMIFPGNGTAAAISNVIWDLGTTAVSSQASSPDSCAGAQEMKTAQFILKSYDALSQQIASGQGQELNTLLSMNGCTFQEIPQAVSLLRAEYSQSLNSVNLSSVHDRSESMYLNLMTATQRTCSSLS